MSAAGAKKIYAVEASSSSETGGVRGPATRGAPVAPSSSCIISGLKLYIITP